MFFFHYVIICSNNLCDEIFFFLLDRWIRRVWKMFFSATLMCKNGEAHHVTSRSLARKKKEEINPICIAIVRKYFPWKTFLLQCSRYFTHVSGPSAGYPFSHTCRERSTTKKQQRRKESTTNRSRKSNNIKSGFVFSARREVIRT